MYILCCIPKDSDGIILYTERKSVVGTVGSLKD
jgi:hypothetical protein